MRRNKLAILLIACIMLTATMLTACGGVDAKLGTEDNYDMLFSFDSQEEINSIKAYWDFGKMQASTDSKYLCEGNASMRLEVLGTQPDYHFVFGDWQSIDDQYLLMYLRENKYMKTSTTDWTSYEGLQFDAFNPGDKDISITAILTTTVMEYNEKAKEEIETERDIPLGVKVVKKGGEKNEISLSFPVEAIYNGLDNVKYLKIVFKNYIDGEEPEVVYIDDMKLSKSSKKPVYTKGYEQNEIAMFESDIDSKLFTTSFDACQYKSSFKYSVNNSAEYASQGVRSLMIERPASIRDYEYRGNMTARMSGKYLQGIDFKKFDKEKTMIAVDVLSVAPYAENIKVGVQVDASTLTKSAALTPLVWTTVYIPMSQNSDDWSRVYGITFNLSEHFDGAPRLLFVDNIRFIVAA